MNIRRFASRNAIDGKIAVADMIEAFRIIRDAINIIIICPGRDPGTSISFRINIRIGSPIPALRMRFFASGAVLPIWGLTPAIARVTLAKSTFVPTIEFLRKPFYQWWGFSSTLRTPYATAL